MSSAGISERLKPLFEGKAPLPLRQALARGAVPLSPLELLSALSYLALQDPEESLNNTARETLANLPSHFIEPLLLNPLLPLVFEALFQFYPLEKRHRELLYQNPEVPDPLYLRLVEREADSSLLEMVARNHTRLLRSPELASLLLEHPSLGPALKSMVEEFFSRAYAGKVLLKQGLKSEEEIREELGEELPPEEVEEVVQEVVASEAEEGLLSSEVPQELLIEREMSDEELEEMMLEFAGEKEEKEARTGNLRKVISKLPVSEKIKLALMGGKEARMLLVLDGNKVVSSLVLRNPRITEQEVKAVASSRAVRDDLLRSISRNKKFMKSYQVKLALVENPKTPPSISLPLLGQLRENDLKRLAKSRSVSSAVQQQARRMVARKQ